MSNSNEPETEFLSFIFSMISSTLVQLGELPNPTTNTLEKLDLLSAKRSIDTLDILHKKTSGNLTPKEEETFSNLLAQVRLRYSVKATDNR